MRIYRAALLKRLLDLLIINILAFALSISVHFSSSWCLLLYLPIFIYLFLSILWDFKSFPEPEQQQKWGILVYKKFSDRFWLLTFSQYLASWLVMVIESFSDDEDLLDTSYSPVGTVYYQLFLQPLISFIPLPFIYLWLISVIKNEDQAWALFWPFKTTIQWLQIEGLGITTYPTVQRAIINERLLNHRINQFLFKSLEFLSLAGAITGALVAIKNSQAGNLITIISLLALHFSPKAAQHHKLAEQELELVQLETEGTPLEVPNFIPLNERIERLEAQLQLVNQATLSLSQAAPS